MSLTVANVRSRVGRAIGMSTSDTSDTDLVDSWFNESVEQFLRDTKMFVTSQTISVTADVSEYELASSLLSFSDIYFDPTGTDQAFLLERIGSQDIKRMQLVEGAFDARPHYYAMLGANKIVLYPAPDETGALLNIWGVPRPAVMSSTADTPSATANGGIPSEFHPVLLDYVLWKAGEAEEHKPSDNGMKFQAQWEQGLAKARRAKNMKTGVMAAPARWGRSKTVPSSPGVDLG